MRYKPEYKAEARARLLTSAASLAKRNGFGTTGVDAFMAAAGLTSGAFYSHFKSKGELLQAIVDHELQRTKTLFAGLDRAALRRMLRAYLSDAHVEHPESGCPLPALSAEVARAEAPVQDCYGQWVAELVTALSTHTGDEAVAWAVLAQVVGAVMMARALPPGPARTALLRSVRTQVESLLEEGK